jgi:hypothetical protein
VRSVHWPCCDQRYIHQVRVQIPSLSGQSRMASTMRSAFRILRVAWNCGISYLRCRVYVRIAVVRMCSIWARTQRLKSHVCQDRQAESSSPLAGPEPSITTASIIRTGHLPQPALGIITEIDRAIRALSRTPAIKDRICEYIQRAVRGFPPHICATTHCFI